MSFSLNRNEIKNLSYPYLEQGYQSEAFEISQVNVDEGEILANCNMTKCFEYEAEGKFHLSGPVALSIVAQTGILHTKAEKNLTKISPVWMKEFKMTCDKQVTNKNFLIKMKIKSEEITEDSKILLKRYDFSFNESRFHGEILLAFVL